MNRQDRPVCRTVPAVTVACAAVALLLTAVECGYTTAAGFFIRLAPSFLEGGFALALQLAALAVPVSMLAVPLLLKKAGARLALLIPLFALLYGLLQEFWLLRTNAFEGREAVLWAVCRCALPLAVLLVLTLSLFGFIKKPFASALVCAASLLIMVVLRAVFAIVDKEFSTVVLLDGAFYLGMAGIVMSLQFPAMEGAAPHSRFVGTPGEFCPSWEDGDIPAELCEKEDITACILLSCLTLGLYQLVWAHRLCRKIRLANGEEPKCTGEYLCLVLVPFYVLYWMYSRGTKLSKAAARLNIFVSNNGVFYLLFACCGMAIFSYAMLQNDLNRIAQRLEQSASAASLSHAEHRRSQPSSAPAEGLAAAQEDAKPAEMQENAPAQPEDRWAEVNDVLGLLRQLGALQKQGVLTPEEFLQKKQELLHRL